MKTTTKLSFSKSVFKTNECTVMETSDRYLNCELTVKGNNSEETADMIMYIMERELRDNGYNFQFSGCPTKDNGEYWDCISIAFETGYMTEYKEAVKEAYKVAKEEIKGSKEVKEDNQKVENEGEIEMIANKVISVKKEETKTIYTLYNGCYVVATKDNTQVFDKEDNYIATKGKFGNTSEVNQIFDMVQEYRSTKGDMEYLQELLEDINNNNFTHTDIFNVIDLIKTYGDYEGTYLYEVRRCFDRCSNYEEALNYINDMINNDPVFLNMVKTQGSKTLEMNQIILNIEKVEEVEEMEIEVVEVDQKDDYSIDNMTLNNGYHVKYEYGKWNLYNEQGEYITNSREWNTNDFNKSMCKVAETYQLNNGNLNYMLELCKEVLGNRALESEFDTLLELIIEFNNNDYFKKISDTYYSFRDGKKSSEYAKGLQEDKNFLRALLVEILEIVEKNSKFLLREINMGVIDSMKKILSTYEPTTDKSYNIWLGTENLKGKKLEVGQQIRIDLYNMDIEELEELKGVNYREIQEGHNEENYTRMYIEIIDIYPIHKGYKEIFVMETYHITTGWTEQKKYYKLYEIKEMFEWGKCTNITIKEENAKHGKDYNYTTFMLYYPIEKIK